MTPFRSGGTRQTADGHNGSRSAPVTSGQEQSSPDSEEDGIEHHSVPVDEQEHKDLPEVKESENYDYDFKYGDPDGSGFNTPITGSASSARGTVRGGDSPGGSPSVNGGHGEDKTAPEVAAGGNPSMLRPSTWSTEVVTSKDQERSALMNYRRGLVRIDYKKLINLSLSNFDNYRESVAVVGYAREWPRKYYAPTQLELKNHCFLSKRDDIAEPYQEELIRKEAYLVLTNTIPLTLKYLIRKVETGDALGVWKTLYNRFLRVTHFTVKELKQEWNSLSMDSQKVETDEFVSLVVRKAENLRQVGEEVSEEDMAVTLLSGLSNKFDWLKTHYRVSDQFDFDVISKQAIDYAADKGMLKKSSKSGNYGYGNKGKFTGNGGSLLATVEPQKPVCFKYNSPGGCPFKEKCKYRHVKENNNSTMTVSGASDKAEKKDKSNKKKKCFKCGSSDHLKRECNKKKEGDEKVPDRVTLMMADSSTRTRSCHGEWYFDSGASHHITKDYSLLSDPVQIQEMMFTVANDTNMVSNVKGTVVFGDVELMNVYFCPKSPINLISEAKLLSNEGVKVYKQAIDRMTVTINNTTLLTGRVIRGLFLLTDYLCKGEMKTVKFDKSLRAPDVCVAYDEGKLLKFHQVHGHLNFKSCKKMLGMDDVKGQEDPVCDACNMSKLIRTNIPREAVTRAADPLYRVYADLSGRKRQSLSGYRYYLLLVDDYSRRRWTYLLKKKSDTLDKIKEFVLMVEKEKPNFKISQLHTDGGGEFVSKASEEFFRSIGVHHNKSAPYSQFQNGVAERSIGVIDDSARSMMVNAGSPTYDWPFAVTHAVYLRNRVLSTAVGEGQVPYDLYTGIEHKDEVKGVFGCLCYAKVYVRGKLDPKARRAVYLGHSEYYKAAMVRDMSSYKKSLREYYCRDVVFDQNVFPYKNKLVPRPTVPPLDLEDLKEIGRLRELEEDNKMIVHEVEEEGTDIDVEQHEEEDLDAEVDQYDDFGSDVEVDQGADVEFEQPLEDGDMLKDDDEESLPDFEPHVKLRRNRRRVARGTSLKALENIQQDLPVYTVVNKDPQTRKEALDSPCVSEWLEAEREEMKSIYAHEVWELVDPKPGMNILGSKFVYKTKRNPDQSIERYKARLVAQGYRQREGVDYKETFASTVNLQSVRLVLWIINFYQLAMTKVDISTFFLYGKLLETIYMKQPPGYVNAKYPKKVCKLSKSLYGTKQAPRCAASCLKKILLRLGLSPLLSDEHVYFMRKDKAVVIICVYVDDLLITSNIKIVLEKVVKDLGKHFKLKVEHDPAVYLSLQIERNKEQKYLKLHQQGYVDQLMKEFKVENCKSRPIPFATVDAPDPRLVEVDYSLNYQELLGKLIWTMKTRMDVLFHVSFLCRYMTRYNKTVYDLAMNLLKYLGSTSELGIVYKANPEDNFEYGQGLDLEFFVDSDWGGSVEDRKSTSGWLAKANGIPIYAQTKLQKRPALSTCEAEGNGVEIVGKEIEWYRGLFGELGIKIDKPTIVWQDNTSTIKLSKDPVHPGRTKYYRISQAYVRHLWNSKILELMYLKSSDHPCDMLNKLTSRPTFRRHLPALMGPQEEFKINLVARVKQCFRTRPKRTRVYLTDKQRSMSDTFPPLFARCTECDKYVRWNKDDQGWYQCPKRKCVQNVIQVTCALCYGPASLIRKIGKWYCAECLKESEDRLNGRIK